MPSTLSSSAQTPTVPLSMLRNPQQQQSSQQQRSHLEQVQQRSWSPIAIDPTATETVTGAVAFAATAAATTAPTTATFDIAGAIEYPDPVMLVPFPISPLGENELPFVFNTSSNSDNSNINSLCTTGTDAAIGVATDSGNAVGGIKRGHDELVEQGLPQIGAGHRQAKRARVMMGSLSPLSDDEVKRMRRVKNRESVEKCRTKQRLRMEALQVEETCLKSENEMLRATVTKIDRLLSAFNKSSAKSDKHCESDISKNKD